MKKLFYLAVFAALLFTSCEEVDKWTKFELDYDTNLTIPSVISIGIPLDVTTPGIETNSESRFSLNATTKDLIEAINLTQMNLNLTAPEGGDFGFLQTVRLYIAADGQPELLVAWKENIPSNAGTELAMDVTTADLKEYVKLDHFTIRLQTTTDELITQNHDVNIYMKFLVDAKILGQ